MIDMLFSLPGLAAILTVICAGVVQGSTGFGFNMLSAPLLALIDPAFVPGPILVMAMVVCIGGALVEWPQASPADLIYSLSGRFVAAIAAALAVGLLSPQAFSLMFGLSVLLAVVLSLSGMRIDTTPRALFGAGVVSGFMGTLTSIGATPMAMVYQNAEAPRMRATLSAYFVFGSMISIAALAMVGRFGLHDLMLGATLLPFALGGFALSGLGRRLMNKGRVKPVVLTISSISAVILLARAIG